MSAPTREMIVAGAREVERIRPWSPSAEVLAESVWITMDETRTKWEQLRTQNISPGDA